MRESFFPLTTLHSETKEIGKPKCGLCKLNLSCKTPKMKVSGKGKRKILVVGEAPGTNEDDRGIQFVGESGQTLQNHFRKYGVDLREDCWLTSAIICRPPNNKIPNDKTVDSCRPNLLQTIKDLNPGVIILLGSVAVDSLIGHLWNEKTDGIFRWAGYRIPSIRLNAWVCPTFHPAFLKYEKNPVLDLYFDRHLEATFRLKGRPYEEVPNYESKIVAELDPRRASELISRMLEKSNTVAFDYETNMLKPDSDHAKIYSCSVSDGNTSVAFPWRGEVKSFMRTLLGDPKIRKVGTNIKFEDRWTIKEFGFPVAGWKHDTMLCAHAQENADKTRKITSIKFQAFVKLGVDRWDGKVESYLKSSDDGGNSVNRIHKLDLPTLLRYNALDSLYEFLVARIQFRNLLGGWK